MILRRILCPNDFSEASAHAIEQAVTMARHYGARLIALHVLTPSPPDAVDLTGSRDEAAEVERWRGATAAAFGDARAKGIGVDVVVDVGPPARVILQHATNLDADLIVMGTHGASGFERLVLGSVTEKVLRQATCPVLTVPPRAQATSHLPFARLVCAVDFSDPSLDAVGCAVSLARESGATLTLLHVLEWPWEEPPPPRLEELPPAQALALAEFRRYSEESASKRLASLVPDSIPASSVMTRIRHGKPYVQILQVADEEHADLIIVGLRGRSPLDLAFLGSTTNQVVRRAACPVLTLR